MNKIYQAFDSIKLDEVSKKNVYQKLGQKPVKQIHTRLIYSVSLVFSVLVFYIVISTNNIPQRGKDTNVNILSIPEGSLNDEIIYDGNTYLLSNDININTINIDKKLGELKQIDSNIDLKSDFESYYHDGYEVYSSNNKNVLIVKLNSDTLVYIKE
jgi:hypothetical protein